MSTFLQQAQEEAARHDAADVLAPFRAEFCFPQTARGEDVVYFTGNSLGLMPRSTRQGVLDELDAWARLGVEGHFAAPGAAFASPTTPGTLAGPAEPWFSYHRLVAEGSAALVGARPTEVVAMGSLTANLHLLMVSFYRPTKQRYKIVIEGGAFPSDRFLVQSQALFHGLDPSDAIIEIMPRAGEDLLRTEDIEAVLDREKDSIAVMLLSGINYYTGQLFDIRRLTRFARERGIVVGWDLAHAAGNVPLSLHDDDADFAAWCTYKYINSGPGAVALSFVHERHARSFDMPRFCGWWSVNPNSRFNRVLPSAHLPPLDVQEGAEGWQISNAPILSLAALHSSLAIFERAGLARLRAKSLALTAFLEALVNDVEGVSIITPTDPAARGAQLSLRVPAGRLDAARSQALLHERGVCVDYRRPDVIRAAPAPLYCRFADVVRFVDALRACVLSGRES